MDSSNENCLHTDLAGSTCIHQNTIDWLHRQQMEEGHNYRLRDLVFMHKPIQEFMHAANLYNIVGNKNQNVGCQALNTDSSLKPSIPLRPLGSTQATIRTTTSLLATTTPSSLIAGSQATLVEATSPAVPVSSI